MIVEVAEFEVNPEDREKFSKALATGIDSVLSKAQGYQKHLILSGIESNGRFLLLVEWEKLEDHTVGFRESEGFAVWRSIIGTFFASAPKVEHFEAAVLRRPED